MGSKYKPKSQTVVGSTQRIPDSNPPQLTTRLWACAFVNLLVFYEASVKNDSCPAGGRSLTVMDGETCRLAKTPRGSVLASRGHLGLGALMSSGWWVPQYAELVCLFIYLFNKHYCAECVPFTGSWMRLGLCLGGEKDWMPWMVWPKCVSRYILITLSILLHFNFVV